MKAQINNNSRDVLRIIRVSLLIVGAIVLFLLSIALMGETFDQIGKSSAETFIRATDNPFIGLFIGLLLTAIIQSSSTTTSMVVAVVAAGTLSLANAIPIIMGANIGTTFTSTIISLGYITKKKAFKKAIAAGTLHDFFNILVVIVIFPLEYFYGFLTSISSALTGVLTSPNNYDFSFPFSVNSMVINPVASLIADAIPYTVVLIFLSFILLFSSIKILSTVISKVWLGESQEKFKKYLFKSPYKSFGWGVLTTAAVQSSSVTTSLSVPLAATGKVPLKKIFPFIMGANIGTTITALFAALFKSDAAIALALAHFLFNILGVAIFLPFPWVRNIPIIIATGLGRLTMKVKLIGFLYIILTFFLIPFLLIYFST